MSAYTTETVLEVQHYTDSLFRIRTTRSPGFRFRSGEFTMIGLEVDGRPLARAYSISSAVYEEYLEFYSIKVPHGPLTSRLQHIQPGDTMLVGKKAVGTLVTDNLLPGRRLYLLSTGTGFAPFASLLKDPGIYELYDNIIVTHTARHQAELVYSNQIVKEIEDNEYFSELLTKLSVFQSVTRESPATMTYPGVTMGRITDLIYNGGFFDQMHLPAFNPVEDRIMICGNPNMMNELSGYLKGIGFEMGSAASPGHFVIEKAFAEK